MAIFNYFYRFIFLCKQLVGLCCKLACPVMIMIMIIKPQSNGPSYSNTVIGTLSVDWWVVAFGTARRELGDLRPRVVSFSLYQM